MCVGGGVKPITDISGCCVNCCRFTASDIRGNICTKVNPCCHGEELFPTLLYQSKTVTIIKYYYN